MYVFLLMYMNETAGEILFGQTSMLISMFCFLFLFFKPSVIFIMIRENNHKYVSALGYHFSTVHHYPRLIKDNHIAAIEIHKEMLIEKYASEFNYETIKDNVIQYNGFSVLGYDDQKALSIFSNQINDGLKLKSTYITNILKCVPPGDKPKNNELINCSNYFIQELNNLKNLAVIVALGKVAFDNCLKIYKKKFKINKKFQFKHSKNYLLPDNKTLIACYHPSPRNVNTKVVTTAMINKLFRKAKRIAKF